MCSMILAGNIIVGQDKNQPKELFGHFVIKMNHVVTQKYADMLIEREANNDKRWSVNTSGPLPPSPPPPAVFNRKKSIHFSIQPGYFTHYTITDEFDSDSTITDGISKIRRIDRVNNKQVTFEPLWFEMSGEYDIVYKDDNSFQLIEENKDKKRQICNFECYQIILRNINNPNYVIEMYVTEKVDVEYHPIFNSKKYLAKYYPLYIKYYDPNFPNDNYEEYKFYKYK